MTSNPLARRRIEDPGTADHRFSRPLGPLTKEDLDRYAAELNAGPIKGWHVKQENGRWALAR